MVFRMLEYDVHIALNHGKRLGKGKDKPDEFAVFFPKSAVLYLGSSGNIPEYEACMIYFQDGTEHIYRVPVMRVQEYSLEKIEERHLSILIPFLLIRFREKIKKVLGKDKESTVSGKKAEISGAEREELRKNLTEFILDCTAVLGHEAERGILTENVRKDIGEFLWKACGYLLEEDTELYKEVSAEVEPAIKLSREIIQELRDDIKGLHQEREAACRRLIGKAKNEGKTAKEAKKELMAIFALTETDAEEKIEACWKAEN